jgi:hypothetical protein
MRRAALRMARSLPTGSERNQQRQIAASLGRLLKNDHWLLTHVHPDRPSRSAWKTIDQVPPYDLPLELAVLDHEGPHALVFPCVRIYGGWADAKKMIRVFVRPTHWREWRNIG